MIRGFFPPGQIYPFVSVDLRIAGVPQQTARINFVIDTGAAVTVIHPSDALIELKMTSASLDPASWPVRQTLAGVGGASRYLVRAADFVFDDDRGPIRFRDELVRIGELRPGFRNLPSLLGWDLLQHFRLAIDPSARTVTLDRQEGR